MRRRITYARLQRVHEARIAKAQAVEDVNAKIAAMEAYDATRVRVYELVESRLGITRQGRRIAGGFEWTGPRSPGLFAHTLPVVELWPLLRFGRLRHPERYPVHAKALEDPDSVTHAEWLSLVSQPNEW